MAALTLKNFFKSFSDSNKLWAAKLAVRECDEGPKGYHVAFVDQGEESFDVQIEIGKAAEILSMKCDCKEGKANCVHKLTLLNFISQKAKVKSPKLAKKTLASTSQNLLDDVSIVDLHQWILELFERDNSLLSEFKLRFTTPGAISLNEKDILKQLKEAASSVVGRKRSIETHSFEKIVNLWEMILLPIAKFAFQGPLEEETISHFGMLMSVVHTASDPYSTRSFIAIDRLEKKITSLFAQKYAQLPDEAIQKALFVLNAKMDSFSYRFKRPYFYIVEEMFKNTSNQGKTLVIEDIYAKYLKRSQNSNFADDELSNILVNLLENAELFEEYVTKLKPVYYNNKFNIRLINALYEKKEYDLVEKHCTAITKSNTKAEYNRPYLIFLKKVFDEQGNKNNLIDLVKQEIVNTYDLEGFLEVCSHITDPKEKTNYRNQTFAIIRRAAKVDKNKSAIKFTVELLVLEQNWKKLIDYIKDYEDLAVFIPFLKQMLIHENSKVIQALGKHSTAFHTLSLETRGSQEQTNSKIYEILLDFYGSDELNDVFINIASRLPYLNPNSIFQFLTEKIIEGKRE